MIKSLFLLVVCLTVFQQSILAQAIIYDILLAGREVGELKITPAQLGASHESLRVEGAINTIFYDVVYIGENRFENGILKTSMSSQEVNGRLKEKTHTNKMENAYQVRFTDAKVANKDRPAILHPIHHTVTSLYYREPVHLKLIYSERFGKMCAVKKLTAHAYEVVMPDGKKTVFTYAEGKCREVRSQIVGIDLVFRIRSAYLPH
ncbi:DUF6134 family protein [Arundinibacter roseus]|uniref:DUF3108 domain-containing protein n=1 Tax=Arundinibacter roseus TaxID=2070510 RepID=A0A4R4K0U5_9BACT|nr:DUF6134 family protein [Arundinibacter roseus]TDB60850.1 hypothetical protein EZE20_20620 [Arundinibacter roseus]